MLRTLSTLAIAAAVGGGGAAAAAEAPHIHAPNAPSVGVKSNTAPKAASAMKPRAGLKVNAPTVSAPETPRLDLRPVDCTGTTARKAERELARQAEVAYARAHSPRLARRPGGKGGRECDTGARIK
jgi:hypothetical protein